MNAHNVHRARRNSQSGIRGVCFHHAAGKWQAYIKVAGRQRHLGYFGNKRDAGIAYAHAKLKHQQAVPVVTAVRCALDAMGVDHSQMTAPRAMGEFVKRGQQLLAERAVARA